LQQINPPNGHYHHSYSVLHILTNLVLAHSPNAGIEADDVDPAHDPATAILRRKAARNKLIVDDDTNDDNSVMTLSTATMEALQLFKGDVALIKGKKRRDTVLIVLADDDLEDNKVRINKGEFLVHFSYKNLTYLPRLINPLCVL
jgi:hypothetical protein